MNRGFTFFISSISLIVGGFIYLCFRPESLTMFTWLKFFGLYPLVAEIRVQVTSIASTLPEWLIFSVPNGLWVFSFGALMVSLWGPARFSVAFTWAIALWAVGIASEVMQFFGLISGFYDLVDVLAYTLGLLGALLFARGGKGYEQ